MTRIFLFSLFFSFVSCGYLQLEEGERTACNFQVDRGFEVKWSSLPISVYIHESVPEISRRNFIYAMDMWNESWNYYTGDGRIFEFIGSVQVAHIPGTDGSIDKKNLLFLDREHGVLAFPKQGSTLIYNNWGGGISEGDIILNNIHFKYYYEKDLFDYSVYTKVPELSTKRSLASTTPQSLWMQFLYAFQSALDFLAFWKRDISRAPDARKIPISKKEVDFISLALHELGHLSAMVHIDHVESIMNAKLQKGQIRRDITEIELASLKCGYK